MSRSSWKLVLIASLCVVAGGAITAAVSFASGAPAIRQGAVPRLPAGSRLIGSLASSQRIRVTVALEPRDPTALESYASSVATPGSSSYREFLSVPQFRQRFAPTDAQIAAVESSLRAHGLNPSPVSANGLAVSATATAGALENAFSTTLEQIALPSGRSAFTNTVAPLLDSSVAGLIQGVIGLDNLSVPEPTLRRSAHASPRVSGHVAKQVATGGPQPCSTASSVASSNGTFTTDQIASAYQFSGLYGAGDEGAGQTVALYELEGNFPSDVTAYESCYGISTSVTYSEVDGGPPAPNPNPPEEDGLETALDVDQVIGLAPKANVIVYQGPNSDSNLPGSGPYDVYNAIISQDKAHVISVSWGECEAQDTPIPTAQDAENTLFQEAAAQGESVFVAAGDSGSEGCDDQFGDAEAGLAVNDPASQPFVTAAGGTSVSALGPPPTESVWNDPASSLICANELFLPTGCGGGGGISSLWKMPSYQSGAPAALHVINSNSSGAPCGAGAGSYCRELPDVSADADPATGYTVYYNGNGDSTDSGAWTPVGGTSGAAPLWAALTADTNALPACNSVPIGFANPVLYGIAASSYAGHFNDITVGNNDILGTSSGLYPAGPGYDMASGLGTPNATALAATMCSPTVGVANPGAQTSRLHNKATLQIVASDSAGYQLGYSASGLPPGLSISSTGSVSGAASSSGNYSVTVRAVDTRGSAATTTFRWTVSGVPKQSHASLTGVGKGRPKLAFTVTAGTAAPKLKKLVITVPGGLSFARKTRSLKRGITLKGPNGNRLSGSFKVSGGKLTITLARAAAQVRVIIASPALGARGSLIKKVRHKRAGKLTIALRVTDASAQATEIKTKLKPS